MAVFLLGTLMRGGKVFSAPLSSLELAMVVADVNLFLSSIHSSFMAVSLVCPFVAEVAALKEDREVGGSTSLLTGKGRPESRLPSHLSLKAFATHRRWRISYGTWRTTSSVVG